MRHRTAGTYVLIMQHALCQSQNMMHHSAQTGHCSKQWVVAAKQQWTLQVTPVLVSWCGWWNGAGTRAGMWCVDGRDRYQQHIRLSGL